MVVQHNLTAMNSNRMLGITTSSQAKSTEKLSSGYRINRAADDAAGLTISEKMRKQMRGLDQASTNAQDGVSAVQTAEGALTEVHSMLQRMNELATQSANGSNSKSDRDAIQAEIEQLTTEIDRVAETTKFNETYLLKGNAEGTTSKVNVNAHDAGIAGKLTDNGDGTSTFKLNAPLKGGDKITVAGKELTIGETKQTGDYATLTALQGQAVELGDKITKADGTELNITNKATVEDVRIAISNLAAGTSSNAIGTLTLADGTTYEFTDDTDANSLTVKKTANGIASTPNTIGSLAANGTATDTWQKLTGEGSAPDLKGATFTDANGNTFELVDKLNRDELTTFDKSTGKQEVAMTANSIALLASNGAAALAVGDSVTFTESDALGNKTPATKTAYDSTNAAGGLKSYDELATALNKLPAGRTVKVNAFDDGGHTGITYTIASNKDAETGNTLTVDSILAKLKEGDLVTFDADGDGTPTAATETFSIAGVDSEEGTVSVKDAYKQIADELAKASSIGTDKGSEATVSTNGDGSFTITQGSVEVKDGLSFALHVGADADMTNKITVDVSSMSSAGLGIQGINVSDDTGMAATYAVDAIADAIAKVSAQRSSLGAVQNRLEHTIANLDNVVENTTAAESRIRDTDMAEEMVNFSKNNILAQAGQSMLAQANQSNQGVLSLLG